MSKDDSFIKLDENGDLIAIDYHTGEETKVDHNIEDKPDTLEKYKIVPGGDGKLVYVPKHFKADVLKEIQGRYFSFPYSVLLADQICMRVVEGEFINKICKEPGMPSYAQFASWRRLHSSLDVMYRMAVRDRAETFLERAVAEVEGADEDKNAIALAKLKSDMFKYVAKVGDPDSFGERQNVKAEVAVTGYNIETGIRRPGDPGFNIDETREVNLSLSGDIDEEA